MKIIVGLMAAVFAISIAACSGQAGYVPGNPVYVGGPAAAPVPACTPTNAKPVCS